VKAQPKAQLQYPTVMIRGRRWRHPNRCHQNPTLTHNHSPTSVNQLSHRSTHPIRFRFRFPTIRDPDRYPSRAVRKTHNPPATNYRQPNRSTTRILMTATVSTDRNRSFRHLNLAIATPPKSLAAFMARATIPASW